MSFWNNPQNNPLKVLLIVLVAIGAGYFIYRSFQPAGAPDTARVLPGMQAVSQTATPLSNPGSGTTGTTSVTVPVLTDIAPVQLSPTKESFGFTATYSGSSDVTMGLDYGKTVAYGTVAGPYTYAAASTAPRSFAPGVTPLECNTTYHYQGYATNSAGTVHSSDKTFTTAPCPVVLPIVTTNSATAFTATSATMNGTSTYGNDSLDTSFKYGTTTSYGSTTAATHFAYNPATSPASTTFSQTLTGLTCNTTYHYQAVATNTRGTQSGADKTFGTAVCPPSTPIVTTGAATEVTKTTARLNLSFVFGVPAEATVGFQYGLTTGYGSSSASAYIPGGSIPTMSTPVTGLTAGTLYHYRAYGTNSAGTGYGADMTFTTSP